MEKGKMYLGTELQFLYDIGHIRILVKGEDGVYEKTQREFNPGQVFQAKDDGENGFLCLQDLCEANLHGIVTFVPAGVNNDHIDLHKKVEPDFLPVGAGDAVSLPLVQPWKRGDENDLHVACPVGSVSNYLSDHDTPIELSTMDFGTPPALGLATDVEYAELEGRVMNDILPYLELPILGVGKFSPDDIGDRGIDELDAELDDTGEGEGVPIPQEVVDAHVREKKRSIVDAAIELLGPKTDEELERATDKMDRARLIHAAYGGGPATTPQPEDRVWRAGDERDTMGTPADPFAGIDPGNMFPGIPGSCPRGERPIISQLADGWKPRKIFDKGASVVGAVKPPEHSTPGGFAAQVTETVVNRGSDYGSPANNHEVTATMWSTWLSRKLGVAIKISAEDVCLLNVMQKLARLAAGTKDDSLLDIAGYVENVAMLRPDQRNTVRSGKP